MDSTAGNSAVPPARDLSGGPSARRPYRIQLALLCLAAFSSGAGSLIYQVVWIRKVTSVTSATATAAAIVVAAFMAGLALGAWLAGRRPWLFRRSLLVYALAELLAAAIALGSIPLIQGSALLVELPLLRGLGIPLIWVAYVAVVLLLMVPTTLLGMSLPLLIAHEERHERGSRYFVNLIYGTNTLGAVAGCLVAGFYTLEHLGLLGSIRLGAALAAFAALIVLPRALQSVTTPPRMPLEAEPVAVGPVLLLTAFACGWVALAAEIVWTRLVALVVTNTVYAYSQVLVAVLVGIAAGGYLGLVCCSWAGSTATRGRLIGLAVALLAMGAVLLTAIPHFLTKTPLVLDHLPELARGHSLRAILTLCLILAPPTAAIAFVLPVLALVATDHRRFQSFGDLYAVNTWGGVAGSLMAGLLLLPWLGLGTALLLLGLAGIGAAAILCFAHPRPLGPAVLVALGLAGVVALAGSVRVPEDLYRLRIGPGARLLDFRHTTLSDVMVTENDAGDRQLWINSNWVAATGGGHVSLGHVPAMFLSQKERALGIGMGTGQTFAAILAMGVRALDCVEINPGVIELAARWFGEANRHLASQPGVRIFHDDGRAFLRTSSTEYDLIILEPLQAWSAGTTQLYTVEFYQEASRRLRPNGVLAQWIPFYGQDLAATQAMVATAIAVFPEATLWLDHMDGILILQQAGATRPPWPELAASFVGFVQREGAMGRLETLADFLAQFLMGPQGLAAWTRDASVLTDDRPFLEFAAARSWGEDFFRDILESARAHRENAEDYFLPPAADHPLFARARTVREVGQRSDLREGGLMLGAHRYLASLRDLEAGLMEVPDSGLLRIRYRMGVRAALARQPDPAAQEELLLRALRVDPDYGEAYYALAVLYRTNGRLAEAAEMEARALANPRVREALEKLRTPET